MRVEIRAEGEIVESQELLNGTRTVAFEASSEDGWTLSGVVSWSRGLTDFVGEGDLTLVHDDGSEVYASLTRAAVVAASGEAADAELLCDYEVDGGALGFADASGIVTGRIWIERDRVRGEWTVAVVKVT
jgi:hypothetical protein